MATTRTQAQIQADIDLWKSRIGVKTTCSNAQWKYIFGSNVHNAMSSNTTVRLQVGMANQLINNNVLLPASGFNRVFIRSSSAGNTNNDIAVNATVTANNFTWKRTGGYVWPSSETDKVYGALLLTGNMKCNLCGANVTTNTTRANWTIPWNTSDANYKTNAYHDYAYFKTPINHGQMIQYPNAATEVTKFEAELLEAKFRDLGTNVSGIGGTFNASIATAIPELTTRYNNAYMMGTEAYTNTKLILEELTKD